MAKGRAMIRQRSVMSAAALCGTAVLVAWAVASHARFGSASISNTNAALVEEQRAASLRSEPEPQDAMPGPALDSIAGSGADVATVSVPAAEPAPDAATSGQPESMVEAAPPEYSQIPPAETTPMQIATASTLESAHTDAGEAVSSLETFDECPDPDICIDEFLWSAYQRTPKRDTVKEVEKKKVTIKKKGRKRTVVKKVTKLVNEDFTWKDPEAAERAGMSLKDYVIGGMDRSFKLKLYHALRALEEAGLEPGITSAFRDDYRQSLAKGLKAASDRSYHGGSSHGGYGHGLAADLVSVRGATRAERCASSDVLWKWIDAHGKEFGIGRPYLDRDPPHVSPIDGKEYAAHQREPHGKHVGAEKKKRGRLAARYNHSPAKRPTARSAGSLKVRTI
jgi:hypothetical protein